MFAILYDEAAEEELRAFRAFEARRILDEVEAQLAREPMRPTKRRKLLEGLVPPWDSVRPVWQLRVGVFRVFLRRRPRREAGHHQGGSSQGNQADRGDSMKVVPLGEAKNQLSAYVETSQHDRVLVTRRRKAGGLDHRRRGRRLRGSHDAVRPRVLDDDRSPPRGAEDALLDRGAPATGSAQAPPAEATGLTDVPHGRSEPAPALALCVLLRAVGTAVERRE